MELSLQNKVAVVTGGGAGLGQACALAFARSGAHVAICDINESTLTDTQAQIEALGVKAVGVVDRGGFRARYEHQSEGHVVGDA